MTEQVLLDALEKLLAEKSIADLTVAEIAQVAGVTTGAIYRRFKDKQDLVRAASERFLARTAEGLSVAPWTDKSLSNKAVINAVLEQTMQTTLTSTHFMRAASALNDLHSFERMTKARSLSADRLAERLTLLDTQDHETLRRKCRFVLRVATATFRDTFMAGQGATDLRRDPATYLKEHRVALTELIDRLTEMACMYLGVRD